MTQPQPPDREPGAGEAEVEATPLAIQLARALEIDLRSIRPATGSGPVTELDVREAVRATANAARSPEPARRTRLEKGRGAAGESGSQSLTMATVAPIAADATNAGLAAETLDRVLHATVRALEHNPDLNSHLSGEELLRFEQVNLAFSVVVAETSVFPVLRDVGGADLSALAEQRSELTERARGEQLRAWELDGGTFTVFDMGALGLDVFTLLPRAPQVAILGLGRVAERPALVDGAVRARTEVPLSLSYDPRAVGALAAGRFLQELSEALGGGSIVRPRR